MLFERAYPFFKKGEIYQALCGGVGLTDYRVFEIEKAPARHAFKQE